MAGYSVGDARDPNCQPQKACGGTAEMERLAVDAPSARYDPKQSFCAKVYSASQTLSETPPKNESFRTNAYVGTRDKA